MHALICKTSLFCAALWAPLAALTPALYAQEDGPPKVLVIHREYLKPGKGGMIHQRSESAFVHAFADGKDTNPYFALDSLSGPTRTLFMFGYDSFADWEKERSAVSSNKALAEKVDQASLMDGDLLSSYDGAALVLRPDLSLNKGSIEGTRFFEITVFVVKPGHGHDFTELAKMYKEAWSKSSIQTHWDCFELVYGNPLPGVSGGDVFLVVNTMKSLAETDQSFKDYDKFAKDSGEGAMQKMSELSAASVAASNTNLFAINPSESNPSKEWVSKEPGFWKVQ